METNRIINTWEDNLKAYGVTEEGIQAVYEAARGSAQDPQTIANNMIRVIAGKANMSLLGESLGKISAEQLKRSELAQYNATHYADGKPIPERIRKRANIKGLTFTQQLKEAYRSKRNG